MNPKELTDIIKEIAVKQQPVKSVFADDVYTSWNSGEVKYGSFNIGLQRVYYQGNQMTYSLVLYYGDRLTQDKSNIEEVYSDGIRAIQAVINTLNKHDYIEVIEPIAYNFFDQKFMDYLGGVYVEVEILTDSELGLCELEEFEELPYYTVTYVGNSGSGSTVDPNSPYQKGQRVYVLDNSFTKEGYRFANWNTEEDGTGMVYRPNDPFIIKTGMTFYAQWVEDPKYTVTYHNNGGEGTMSDPNSPYDEDSTVTVLANSYTRYGHRFDSWNTESDGVGTKYEAGDTFTITKDTTLYAQWKELPKYAVVYSGNGGSGSVIDTNSPYYEGSMATILANSFDREHYDFIGWNTKADGTGISYSAGDVITVMDNVTLYAQWEEHPKYMIIYVGNGGSGSMTDPNSPYYVDSVVTVMNSTYTKDGYNFHTWNTKADGTGEEFATGSTFVITGDTTLYAIWEAIPLSVTYMGNGGSGSVVDPSSPYITGDTVTVLGNEFTREHFTFSSWNTAADGSGIEYEAGDTFEINSPVTLYAQWVEDAKYTIIYVGNGGSGTMVDPNSPYYAGSTVTVLVNSYTREHYTFNNWNTAADGSGTDYATGSTFTITGNTTLYAQWEEDAKYSVTYSNNGGSGSMSDPNSPYYVGSTVTILANSYTKEDYYFNTWNTAADGTGEEFATGATFTITGNTTLYAQWVSIYDYASAVTFTAQEDNSTIGLARLSSNQSLEYSTDVSTWTNMDTATTITLNSGETVFVRGILSGDNTANNYTKFTMSGSIAASGNINNIWNYQNSIVQLRKSLNPNVPLKAYCGREMFSGCSGLTDVTQLTLPSTTLATHCYDSMFQDCTSLVSTPALPATTLAEGCYVYMFSRCTSLTQAPELPATSLAKDCYEDMFMGCSSLTKAPMLPATTLAQECYQYMFSGCTSLNEITCLATNISASNCTTNWVANVAPTGTFYKDESMTGWTIGDNGIPTGWVVVPTNAVRFTAQEDNSTIGLSKLSCHQYLAYSTDGTTWTDMDTATTITLSSGQPVFVRGTMSGNNDSDNYTKFTMSGSIAASGNCNYIWNYTNPDAALARNYCGYGMFSGCTALTDVTQLTLPSTALTEFCYHSMFKGCTSLVSVPELPATSLAKGCYEFMFDGCTSLTQAPELPATTLAQLCYGYMFNGCSSLTKAPVLSAATLKQYCYELMFKNCTSLNEITCLATDISAYQCTFAWVSGVPATGTFTKDANMSGWGTGNNGIPTGWTVQDYQE